MGKSLVNWTGSEGLRWDFAEEDMEMQTSEMWGNHHALRLLNLVTMRFLFYPWSVRSVNQLQRDPKASEKM